MQLIEAPKPFSNKRTVEQFDLDGTLEQLVQVKDLPEEFAHIWVNGKFVHKDDWSSVGIQPTDHIFVKTVPMGGDSGKDVLRTLAFIAVAVLVPQFGFASGLSEGASLGVKLAAVAADTAIIVAATFAINALIPLPQPDDPGSAEDRFTISGTRNQLSRYGSIPVCFGSHKMFPPYGAMPYTEVVGSDSYLRVLFCLGYGPVEVSNIKIGQTDIGSFSDVQYGVRYGYVDDPNLSIFSSDVFEDNFSVKLNGTSGSYQTRTTQSNVDEATIDVAFPVGATRYRSDGDTSSVSKNISVEYRLNGSVGAWTSASSITFTANDRQPFVRSVRIVFPSNGTYDVRLRDADGDSTSKFAIDSFWTTMRSVTKVQPVNMNGLAYLEMRIRATEQLNGIIDTLNATVTSVLPAWTGTAWVSAPTANPAAHFLNVARGPANARNFEQNELRTTGDASGFGLNNSSGVSPDWVTSNCAMTSVSIRDGYALRGTFSGTGYYAIDLNDLLTADLIAGDEAVISFKVRGSCTVQVGQTATTGLTTISSTSTVGDEWDEIVYKFIYGSGSGQKAFLRISDGAGTSDITHLRVFDYQSYPIDLDRLEYWYNYNVTNSFSHDFVQTEAQSVYDTLTRICATGRASHSMYDGKHSIIIDEPQTIPVQHFTPENSAGFSGSKLFPEEFHAVKIRFLNEAADYEEDEMIIYDDGYSESNATKFTSLDVSGVTNSDHIWKIGRYYMATFRLRPEQFEVDVDLENVICTRGDLVRVTHDVAMVGLGYGRVVSATNSQVTLDAPILMESGKTYSLRFRTADGTSVNEPITLNIGEQTTVSFTNAPISTIPEADSLFMFGESGQESQEFLVKGIIAGQDMSATIIMEPYHSAVYTADTGVIPPYSPVISIPAEMQTPAAPVHQYTTATSVPIGSGNSKSLQPVVTLIFRQASGSTPIVKWESQFRAVNTDVWKSMNDSLVPVVTANSLEFGGTYDFRVRATSAAGRSSPWTVVTNVSAGFSPLIPDSISQLVATTGGARNISWIWDWPLDPETGNKVDNIKDFQLWVSNDNNRANATLAYEGLGTSHSRTYNTAVTNYAWIKVISRFSDSVESTWYPTSATGGIQGTCTDHATSSDFATAIAAAATAQSTADGKIETYFQDNPPTVNLADGDLWVDTDDNNKLYRYQQSSTTWILIQDSNTSLVAANDAQATADGKVTSFFSPSAPTPEGIGDIWFDTDDNNKPYRYNGSVWESVQDGSIETAQLTANTAAANALQAIADAATAQGTADGKVTTYYSPSAPIHSPPTVVLAEGDLWIDLDDGNKLYRWNTSGDPDVWTLVQDQSIATAIANAATAQNTADGKIVSYFSASGSPPAGTHAVGDLWYQTDTDFVKRWNGTNWDSNFATIGAPDGTQVGGIPSTNVVNPPQNAVTDSDFSGAYGNWDYEYNVLPNPYMWVTRRNSTVGKHLSLYSAYFGSALTTSIGQKEHGWLECDAGSDFLCSFKYRVGTVSSGSITLGVRFYDSGKNAISTLTAATINSTNDNTTGFESISGQVTAPANTAYAQLRVDYNAAVITGIHSLTHMYIAETSETLVPQTPQQSGPPPGTVGNDDPTTNTGLTASTPEGTSYTNPLTGLSYTFTNGAWVQTTSNGAPQGTSVHPQAVDNDVVEQWTTPSGLVIDSNMRKAVQDGLLRYWQELQA